MYRILDYLGFYGYFSYLLTFLIIIYLFATAFYLLPFFQMVVSNYKVKWLRSHFKNNPSSGENEDQFRAELLLAAEPVQKEPLFKFLRLFLNIEGVFLSVFGLILLFVPDQFMRDEGAKILIFIPLIIGIISYANWKKNHENDSVNKEIAAFFLTLGILITGIGFYFVFELNETFIRSDIYLYVILGLVFYFLNKLDSYAAGVVYLIGVQVSASMVYANVGYNWLLFMTHGIWIFQFLFLFFWIPKLKEMKGVEFKDIILALFFTISLVQLSIVSSSGLILPAFVVVLPFLYVFGRNFFYEGTWFGAKPLQTFVQAMMLVSAIGLCFPELVHEANISIHLFEDYTFYKQIAYFILLFIGLATYFIVQNMERDQREGINYVVIFYPCFAFFCVYFLDGIGAHYIINLALAGIGCYYLWIATQHKNTVHLILGTFALLAALIIRYVLIFEKDIEDKDVVGVLLLLVGGILLAVNFAAKSAWNREIKD